MFDWEPLPGAVKEWKDESGNVTAVLVSIKKQKGKRRRTRSKKSKKYVRIYTPEEFARLTPEQIHKLTQGSGHV